MELPFDLSHVMFITTANSVDSIPGPLLDRLEIIEVSSYTEEEKLRIARKHLLPKQILQHGLKPASVKVSEKLLKGIIEGNKMRTPAEAEATARKEEPKAKAAKPSNKSRKVENK